MAIDDETREGKSQCSINRESAKISAWFFRKIDNCEYQLTGKKILLSNQMQYQHYLLE